MSDFELVERDGEICECNCCGYPAPLMTFDIELRGEPVEQELCEICASTHLVTLANPGFTSSAGSATALLARSLGWIANHVLQAVSAGDKLKADPDL